MPDYRINRDRYPLGSNGAGQIELTCQGGCGNTFDVGVERARTPGFTAFCADCWIAHLDLIDTIGTLGDAA